MPPRRGLVERFFGETPTAWLYILPAVVIIVGLAIVPVFWSLLLSFQDKDPIAETTSWAGLDNYSKLLDDDRFRGAVEHTLVYTGLFVPLSILGGLGLALLLNKRVRFIGIYRTLAFVPVIVSATVQGVLFSVMFDDQVGVANGLLDKFGLAPQPFFADGRQALLLLVLAGLWAGTSCISFCAVIFLAALQDIPRELTEAASIDGARSFGTFLNVTLPALVPVGIFLLLWQTVQGIQLFDLVYGSTAGGPGDSTVVVVYFIYRSIRESAYGVGAAASYLVVGGLVVVALAVIAIRRLAGLRREKTA
ncbi:carbohydrate ABC transporter permease [Conexibacter woesei]|uniref:Binding-protein-dependent transport systems inner membrane component n=1 Tax=Conexibacter woesei (strain DSM 14684 / CCUG 47730 / CIP 108061 / JCM 11494 / NBRC 100937 / ID131577) TaxID=469383 RepID=D3F2S1_CONWI|nr:sugar ABC transporter permease [Conexibacter woesei]ADB54202.1 binding-protein-dependent transport systems inner membrane component [Conexibacter woesei DSM 14684]